MSVKHTVLPEGHPSRCFYNCGPVANERDMFANNGKEGNFTFFTVMLGLCHNISMFPIIVHQALHGYLVQCWEVMLDEVKLQMAILPHSAGGIELYFLHLMYIYRININ